MNQSYTDIPPAGQPISGQVFLGRTRPMVATLKRTWWLFLVQGFLAIVLGVSAIVWPEAAVTVLVTFLGANLVLLGAVAIAMALRIKRATAAHR